MTTPQLATTGRYEMTQINPNLIEKCQQEIEAAGYDGTFHQKYIAIAALTAAIGEPVCDLKWLNGWLFAVEAVNEYTPENLEKDNIYKALKTYRALFADGADTSAGGWYLSRNSDGHVISTL